MYDRLQVARVFLDMDFHMEKSNIDKSLIVDVFMPEFTNMNCFKCFVLASVSPFCRKE